MKRTLMTSTLLLALSTGGHAWAAENDPIAAEALFDEGRRLMKEERYAEACVKFEASQSLDPGVGTLLNLGNCLERAGRYASAWVRFREAASAALTAGQRDRESIARARANAIEGMLVRVAVHPSEAVRQTPGIVITRDGVVLTRDTWGALLPIDPGRHELRATAPGKRPWSKELVIDDVPGIVLPPVSVPELEDDHDAVAPGNAQRTSAWVVGGVGAAAMAASVGLALGARSAWTDAEGCAAADCRSAARDDASRAGRLADAATGMLVGGAVAVGVGVVLYLTAPRALTTTTGALGATFRF